MATCSHRRKGMTHKEFFSTKLRGEILDLAQRGNEIYIALRTKDRVLGIAVETSWDHYSHHNFWFKTWSEDMGPIIYNCPERILNLLSPTTDDYAIGWRDKCRKRAQQPKLKKGMLIKFKDPIQFTSGAKGDIFRVVDLRRRLFVDRQGYRYKIPKPNDRDFMVLERS